MSIEEMIAGLTVLRADNEIGEEYYQSVVAALLAGQKCFQEACIFTAQRAIQENVPMVPTEGMQAWDAALGEKE